MKVVVTGGLGKAGQWIVRELCAPSNGSKPHEVLIFDQTYAQLPSTRCLAGDIRDQGQVFEALAGSDAVVHLAGVPRHGIATNAVTIQTNVMAALNVHEAAWRLGISRVVTVSSEAILGWAPGAWERQITPDYLPIDEDHPVRPQDAYGLSKQLTEAIAASYSLKSDMVTVLLRPPKIVTPAELDAIRESNGIAPQRFALFNYIDARDLAAACRLAVEAPLHGSNVFFAGSGQSLAREPLSTLYPRIMPAIGDKAASLTGDQASVSNERITTTLDWKPQHLWRERLT